MSTKDQVAKVPATDTIALKLNDTVMAVIGKQGLIGFHRAYAIADGIQQLKTLLTPEYMAPIMAMQGNRLGFKTDKDKTGGYSVEIVKDCLIEAVLMGLQPYGNHFNIIAGNMYMTKEGAGYSLNNNFKGLSYDLVCSLPRISENGTSAAVEVTINWKFNGEEKTKVIPIPIKVNAGMGVDAIIGKATRKGRAWLISTITGIEIADGDTEDAGTAKVVSSNLKKSTEQHENERLLLLISESKTMEELNKYKNDCKTPEQELAFTLKAEEITNN